MIEKRQELAYSKKTYSLEEIKKIGFPTMFAAFIDERFCFEERKDTIRFFDNIIETFCFSEGFKLNIIITECLADFSEILPKNRLIIRTNTLEETKKEVYDYYIEQFKLYLSYLEKQLDKNTNKNSLMRFLNDNLSSGLTTDQLSEQYKEKINKTKESIMDLGKDFVQNKLPDSINFTIRNEGSYVLPEILKDITHRKQVYCVSLTNSLFPFGFNRLIIDNIKFNYFRRYQSLTLVENVLVDIETPSMNYENNISLVFNPHNRDHYIFTTYRDDVVLFVNEDEAKEFTKKLSEELINSIQR